MARSSVHFSDAAYADLASLFEYVRSSGGSARTAKAFVDRISQRCRQLGDQPFSGHSRDDLSPGLRTIAFDKVIIAYSVEDDSRSDRPHILRRPGL